MTAKIGSESWVSISLVGTLILVAVWATLVYSQGTANASDISKMETRQMQYEIQLKEVNEKLAELRGMLLVKSSQ